ncbi:MAG: MerR family transcriptional regulator [Anaerolineae bacterium]|nr:MerR family transcriptional regulator [Anaerolineae bacterium]
MYTIGQVGELAQLSRSTLLYYDRIGLLPPSNKSPAGYRLYSEADLARLERIRTYRAAGLSLERIGELLRADNADDLTHALEARLIALNQEIQQLREQQRLVLDLLGQAHYIIQGRVLDKSAWTALLREAGLDDAAMLRWHQAFEQSLPEAHQDFLESLGLDASEIVHIRQLSHEV